MQAWQRKGGVRRMGEGGVGLAIFVSGFYTSLAHMGTTWWWCHACHLNRKVCFYPATMWVTVGTALTTRAACCSSPGLLARQTWAAFIFFIWQITSWSQHWQLCPCHFSPRQAKVHKLSPSLSHTLASNGKKNTRCWECDKMHFYKIDVVALENILLIINLTVIG